MTKQFWAVIAVIVIIFAGVFIISGNKNKGTTSKSAAAPSQNIIGKGSTGVTLVEYGDFECPYCEEYAPAVQQAQAKYNDQIFFQFRNFPLVNVHPNAFAASRAAEAAALQNKFWGMYEALYLNSNWQVWSTASDPTPYFNQYATQLGLNPTQFKADFASSKVNDTVNADMAAGNKLGVQGTPTFFLDGKQTTIGPTLADFEKAIDAAIASKTASTKK